MKISIISTVKNEGKTINKLLKSLSNQSVYPSEFIFVNDSSKDDTKIKIQRYKKKLRNLKIIDVSTSSISCNRNIGVKNSKGDWIISIDGGCYIGKDYVKDLISCFNKNPDKILFGALTRIPYKSSFEHCYSILIERKLTKGYLPKGHALFFKKELWENLKGFNEKLKTAEDTDFVIRAKNKGYPLVICGKAVVFWKPRGNLKEVFSQFYRYGMGDRNAFGIKNLPLKSKLNLIITLLFPLSLVHALMISFKNLYKLKSIFSLGTIFLIDLTKIFSYSIGVLSSKLINKNL
jgi:glycosyltransferase involved in cell wall biosynthesis